MPKGQKTNYDRLREAHVEHVNRQVLERGGFDEKMVRRILDGLWGVRDTKFFLTIVMPNRNLFVDSSMDDNEVKDVIRELFVLTKED